MSMASRRRQTDVGSAARRLIHEGTTWTKRAAAKAKTRAAANRSAATSRSVAPRPTVAAHGRFQLEEQDWDDLKASLEKPPEHRPDLEKAFSRRDVFKSK